MLTTSDLAKYATVLSSLGLRLCAYVFLRWVNKTSFCAGRDRKLIRLTLALIDTR